MDINQLIEIVKNKLNKNIDCDNIKVEDKTFLHKDHKTHDKNKYHITIIITSDYLRAKNKITASPIISPPVKEVMGVKFTIFILS